MRCIFPNAAGTCRNTNPSTEKEVAGRLSDGGKLVSALDDEKTDCQVPRQGLDFESEIVETYFDV